MLLLVLILIVYLGEVGSFQEKTYLSTNFNSLTETPTLVTDQYNALFELYNSTNGVFWKWYNLSSNSTIPWNFSNPNLNNPCFDNWQGITCICSLSECNLKTLILSAHNLSGTIPTSIEAWAEITTLDFGFNQLFGEIPGVLGQLTHLNKLDLSNNNFTREIPPEIGNLESLVVLELGNNLLVGTIPDTVYNLVNLQTLDLESNFLLGNISAQITNFQALQVLDLNNNFFDGTIPLELYSLANLQIIHLAVNYFRGTISDEIDQLQALTIIDLQSNLFNGPIPVSITNLTTLKAIHFDFNEMSGTIPEGIGDLKHLTALNIQSNYFNGTVPDSLYNLTTLIFFNCEGNALIGRISESLKYLINLNEFGIGFNNFFGEFPDVLQHLPYLNILSLKYNRFHSTIPSSIGYLSNLTSLSLNSNRFYSTIPRSIGLLHSLRICDLSVNELTGPIPPELGNLTHLESFLVIENQLVGSIPQSILNKNTSTLKYFGLSNNSLTGTVPIALNYLHNLKYLSLARNAFYGNMFKIKLNEFSQLSSLEVNNNFLTGPMENIFSSNNTLLTQLNCITNQFSGGLPDMSFSSHVEFYEISQNYFVGTVPNYFRDLENLFHWEMSDNYLYGTVPDWMGYKDRLKYVNISFNLLTGPVNFTVPEYKPLLQLNQFSLQNNFLTGTIPKDLGEINDLTDLTLNDNSFSGSIPKSFVHLLNLEILFLQNNQLTGSLPDFDYTYTLTNVDVTNNLLTGMLPSSFIKFPKLNTFSASSNCFRGSIPADVCKLTRLSVLALDGLSTASNCRIPIFPGSKILTAFTLAQTVENGIPQCLFSMECLKTLHLSGNGLTGSFPSSITVAENLTDLILSHNQLTGTIPDYIQERPWKTLDLSYNKLAGTLSSNFHSFDSDSTLSLEINRLSGPVAMSIQSAENINILEGNMFSCDVTKRNLPTHDQKASDYSCGSDVVNATIYSWLGIVFVPLFLLISFIIYTGKMKDLRHSFFGTDETDIRSTEATRHTTLENSYERSVALYSFLQLILFWRTYYLKYHDRRKKIPRILFLRDLFHNIRLLDLLLFIMAFFLLFPTYISLNSFFSSYDFSYAWSVSAMLLSGETAGIILTVIGLIFLLSFILTYEVLIIRGLRFTFDNNPRDSGNESGNNNSGGFKRTNLSSLTSRFTVVVESIQERNDIHHETKEKYSGRLHYYFDILALVFIFMVNLMLMLSADIGYVYIFLNFPTVIIIFTEIFLALFKISLNNTLLWVSIPFMKRTLRRFWVGNVQIDENNDPLLSSNYFYTTKDTLFITISILFNNIIFPVLAIFFVSSDCFYSGISSAAGVESSYTYSVCDVYTPAYHQICLSRRTETESSVYEPPFIYNYQCASTIIINYAPVFIIMYTFEGILNIMAKLYLKYYYDWLKKRTQGMNEFDKLQTINKWYLMLFNEVEKLLPNYWKNLQPKPDFTGERQSYFFDKNRTSVRVSAYLVVMMSFGALFPPLALIIGVTIFTVTGFEEIVIGRLLYESERLGFDWYQKQLEKDCYGIADSLKYTLWSLVPVSSILYAYVIFDTWGDREGWQAALAPSLIVCLFPIACVIFSSVYQARFSSQRDRLKSAGVEFQGVGDSFGGQTMTNPSEFDGPLSMMKQSEFFRFGPSSMMSPSILMSQAPYGKDSEEKREESGGDISAVQNPILKQQNIRTNQSI
jgi:Leucine-rich repeat (LRR) protein